MKETRGSRTNLKLFTKAQALITQGKINEGLRIFDSIVKNSSDSDLLSNMASVYGSLGRMESAEECSKKAVHCNDRNPMAHANLGNCYMAQRRYSDAADCFNRALALSPKLAAAWLMLGRAHSAAGNDKQATIAYSKTLELQPDWAEAHYYYGVHLRKTDASANAVKHLRRASVIRPDFHEIHIELALALNACGNYKAALSEFNKALEFAPGNITALNGQAAALANSGQLSAARQVCNYILALEPEFTDARLILAMIQSSCGEYDAALESCRHVLEKQPGNINATTLSANIHERMGRINSAYDILRPLLQMRNTNINIALAYASISKELNEQESAIEGLNQILENDASLSSQSRRKAHFMLGKLLDSINHYDAAFFHYRSGNELKEATFDKDSFRDNVSRIINVFTKDLIAELTTDTTIPETEPTQIFIVGMPRSGTSLTEAILSAHDKAFPGGESNRLETLARSLGKITAPDQGFPEYLKQAKSTQLHSAAARYMEKIKALAGTNTHFVDKTPGNLFYLGLIQLLFPSARIVYCTRNPIDTCISCYFQDFMEDLPYAYSMGNLICYYTECVRMAEHWKSVLHLQYFELEYETLISKPDETIFRLLEFCGLEWSDRCLSFHEAGHTTPTASYDQIRNPLYSTSVNRWKHYSSHIGELIQAFNGRMHTSS